MPSKPKIAHRRYPINKKAVREYVRTCKHCSALFADLNWGEQQEALRLLHPDKLLDDQIREARLKHERAREAERKERANV